MFNHGDLKIENILVANQSTSFSYENMTHSSNITFKLSDFERSSMTLDRGKKATAIRMYNRNPRLAATLKVFAFDPKINKQFGELYYQVEANLDATSYARIRHMGVPYYSSWDTYTFIVSLLSLPQVFFPVFTDPTLKRILFDDMFFAEDTTRIYNGIFKAVRSGNTLTMDQILKLLRNSKLKCEATETLFDSLVTFTL